MRHCYLRLPPSLAMLRRMAWSLAAPESRLGCGTASSVMNRLSLFRTPRGTLFRRSDDMLRALRSALLQLAPMDRL